MDIELHVFDYHSSIVTPKNIKKFFEKNYVSPRSTRRTALRSLALCLDSHPPHRSGLCLLGCLRPHCLHFFQLVGAIYSLALLITIVDSGSFLTFVTIIRSDSFLICGTFIRSDSFIFDGTLHRQGSFLNLDTVLVDGSF